MVQLSTPGVTPNRGMGPRKALFVKLLWPLVCSAICWLVGWCYSLTLNISETVRDSDIVSMEWTYKYALLNSVISNELEWLSKICDDTNHSAASLRQQSYLWYTTMPNIVASDRLHMTEFVYRRQKDKYSERHHLFSADNNCNIMPINIKKTQQTTA